jgi:hypothetical protein
MHSCDPSQRMDVRRFSILIPFFRFHLCSWRKLEFSFTLVPNWKFQSLCYRFVNFINFCFWRKLILLFNSYLEAVKQQYYIQMVPSDFTAISCILVWTCYSNVLYTSLWFIWTCYFMINRITLENRYQRKKEKNWNTETKFEILMRFLVWPCESMLIVHTNCVQKPNLIQNWYLITDIVWALKR